MNLLSDFLQQVTNGVAVGGIYALVGLGFVLIYKATHVVNFAHGEFMMVGAFLFYSFHDAWGMSYGVGAALAIALVGIVGGGMGRILSRSISDRQALAGVLVTVGIGMMANNGVRLVPGWGNDTRAVSTPFADQIVTAGTVVLSGDRLAIVVSCIVLIAALQFFLMRTRRGLAIRAMSHDRMTALQMGVPIPVTTSMIWAASTGLAAFAGILLAPAIFVHADMGYIAFHAFPAAVLGGFVSIPGTIVGGIAVGVAEELAGFYLPEGVKNVVPHAILLMALLLRPRGFFESPKIRDA